MGVQRIILHHVLGPRSGDSDVLSLEQSGTALLGRAPFADVCFPSKCAGHVSRRHALLWLSTDTKTGWYVVDLESLSGTMLNGTAIRVGRLANNDLISLGESGPTMRVEMV